ncbi:MAG: CBS domain-containing protein [Gammaproteobacteria bacterium]|nr:CBS domain-containing protein [Gammaproteobacteria bacterium]
MITVEEFMTSELCTMSETDTVDDARKVMTERHIRHIPITDDENRLVGLVTQRNILAATGPEPGGHINKAADTGEAGTLLSDIMIKNVSVVNKTDSLRTAAIYMQSHKYGCLPVVSDGRLAGIITDSDFIAIAINLIEQAELSEEELDSEDVI